MNRLTKFLAITFGSLTLLIYVTMPRPAAAIQADDTIFLITWDTQGKYVAYSSELEKVAIFDVTSSSITYSWSVTGAVNALAINPNVEEIALAQSESVSTYNFQGGLRQRRSNNVQNFASAINYSQDGTELIIGYSGIANSKTLEILDLNSGAITKESPMGAALSLNYANNLGLWVSAGYGLISVWNSSLTEIAAPTPDNGFSSAPIWKILWSPSGSFIATGSQDGTVGIWSFSPSDKTLDVLHVLRGSHNTSGYYNQSAILDMKFSADGQRLLTLGADGTLRMWDVGSGSLLSDESLGAPIRAGAFNPVNDTLALLRFNTPMQIVSVSNKLENATPSPMPANTPSPRP